MRYFVLSTPGQPDEIARWTRHSAAYFYNAENQRWTPDPLLAIELTSGEDWRPIDPALLPPDLIADDPEPQRPTVDRRSRSRRSSRAGLFRRFR